MLKHTGKDIEIFLKHLVLISELIIFTIFYMVRLKEEVQWEVVDIYMMV